MKSVILDLVHCILILVTINTPSTHAQQLKAFFSQHGVHGQILIEQKPHQQALEIDTTDLYRKVDTWDNQWHWSIHEFPVDYTTLEDRCGNDKLGSQLVDLDSIAGLLDLNDTKLIHLNNDQLQLTGSEGIWGSSILLENVADSSVRTCATLSVGGSGGIKLAEARFYAPVAGSVYFEWAGFSALNATDALIIADLKRLSTNKFKTSSEHKWKIFVTNAAEAEKVKSRDTCDFLQFVYENAGHLDVRLGKLKVGKKTMYRDPTLSLIDFKQNRQRYYLVIYDNEHEDSYLSCSPIFLQNPSTVKATINHSGIKATITFSQKSPYDVTFISYRFHIPPPAGVLGNIKIHDLPIKPGLESTNQMCQGIRGVYNPTKKEGLEAEISTQDNYPLGDLSNKLGTSNTWDVYLPLKHEWSIAHRALVLYRLLNDTHEEPWICTALHRFVSPESDMKLPMITAQVLFRYPTAGRIIFRQEKSQPLSDTMVLVESMVHADGNIINNTFDHRWSINTNPPGKDFYNWTARCVSAGGYYDPYQVYLSNTKNESLCSPQALHWCQSGDLSSRLGRFINIAGEKVQNDALARQVYFDRFIPLSGPGSVLGKSFVLYDDYGPKARGDRLACSRIERIHRRKAVVHDWFGNGELAMGLKGKVEFFQESEYDFVDIELDFQGLSDNSGYHIHMTSVQESLEFPCEDSVIYGHWNPFGISKYNVPPPKQGTPDQYEVGDLSGKFGTLEGLPMLKAPYNDTTIQLFGQLSILGRSMVVEKRHARARWACSSIERGYAPVEARELRAIASFDREDGFVYGYVKLTQLIHSDGTQSETVIEANLRYAGRQNRNVTRDHEWAIYVNPVGVDATVKVLHTRCTAAGYIWNPYYTQLAAPLNDELYKKECGADHPLRCYVGDMSHRLGTVDIGDKKKVFSDPNLPLEGAVSAMGRSLVIFTPDRGHDRMACANLLPDKDIIKYVNVKKTPRFEPAEFISDVRDALAVAEWIITADSRKTKTLHDGTCVQFLVHFKGPDANELELLFSKLMDTGRVDLPRTATSQPSRLKRPFGYQNCNADDNIPKKKTTFENPFLGYSSTASILNDRHHLPLIISISLLTLLILR
uniref:Superoxide dismutase copper/zinc binding domain-containing protein n=1 Tax=Cacopsylla melanoneura TaxID=428564 RepID=A0A8D8WQN7_9HEMI